MKLSMTLNYGGDPAATAQTANDYAENNFHDAIKIAKALTMRPLLMSCYKDLSHFHKIRGDEQKADEFSQKSEQIRHEFENLNRDG